MRFIVLLKFTFLTYTETGFFINWIFSCVKGHFMIYIQLQFLIKTVIYLLGKYINGEMPWHITYASILHFFASLSYHVQKDSLEKAVTNQKVFITKLIRLI